MMIQLANLSVKLSALSSLILLRSDRISMSSLVCIVDTAVSSPHLFLQCEEEQRGFKQAKG